jgi:hypothetical protein
MRAVKPWPDAFWGLDMRVETAQKEVIMTSTRKYYGSQDFSELDIPVT